MPSLTSATLGPVIQQWSSYATPVVGLSLLVGMGEILDQLPLETFWYKFVVGGYFAAV
jgi:hypothetical protein